MPNGLARLRVLLLEQREALLSDWLDRIAHTYSSDGGDFLLKQKNRFQNPVGYALQTETEVLFEQLVGGFDMKVIFPSLENILKIRAVQDFTPARAVGIVFFLKDIIRTRLTAAIREDELFDELFAFESRIDDLALLAFDIFVNCREKLYDIRAGELRRRYTRLLTRAKINVQGNDKEDFHREGSL